MRNHGGAGVAKQPPRRRVVEYTVSSLRKAPSSTPKPDVVNDKCMLGGSGGRREHAFIFSEVWSVGLIGAPRGEKTVYTAALPNTADWRTQDPSGVYDGGIQKP
jgi:hypothetical protein